MANVAHSSLTGSNLHEPKGVATATSGQVYVANGSGTGIWTDISATAFTGMIADFTAPVVPNGWLELDGSAVSTTTYAALYSAMTIQQTASRGSGSAIISGLSSTTHMRPGYFVFGTGIASGTTILTVDSAVQITMSANAASSGSATVIVSPWLIAATTITLPNVTTSGRYRRSRTSALHIGVTQADLLKNHTHSGTTASNGSHTHSISTNQVDIDDYRTNDNVAAGTGTVHGVISSVATTTFSSGSHTHTLGTESAHTHTFTSGTPDSALGGTETRPLTLIVMTCVKT